MGDCAKAFVFVLLVLTAGAVLFIGLDGEDSYASAEGTFTATNDEGVVIEYMILTEGTGTEHGTVQVGDGQMHSAAVNVEIPSMVESGGRTYDVIGIGNYAFQGCSSLTSVTILDGVTSIGYSAFDGCSSLTSVTIPNSVISIGYSAFDGCSSLTSITIPDGVISIGKWTFQRCSSLTSVTIPDGVTSIGDCAFYECSSLTSVTIPNSVTSIGNYAFDGCSSLTSVTILDGVTSIGEWAFCECSSLTSVTILDGVTSIGNFAFYGCSSLTSVTIPNSVTSIGDWAFYGVCNGDNAGQGAKVGHTLTLIPEGSICQSRESGTYYECETCGTLFKMADGIPTKVDDGSLSKHSMTLYNSVKKPTCTEPGHKACYQCSVCGKYFEDSEGMKGIPDLEAWRSEEGAGYISPSGHTMTLVNGSDPTCTEPGYDECYHCDICGKYFEDSEGMKGIPDLEAWRSEEGAGYIGPAGHVFGDDGVCTVCGYGEDEDPEPDPSRPGQSDPGQSDTDASGPSPEPDDGSPGDGNSTLYVGIGAVAAVIIAVGAFLFLRGRS